MSDPDSLLEFPCQYAFKVFGRRSDAFVECVQSLIAATLGPVSPEAVTWRESSQGRYLSVTVLAHVDNRGQLERVYADLRADARVLFYI